MFHHSPCEDGLVEAFCHISNSSGTLQHETKNSTMRCQLFEALAKMDMMLKGVGVKKMKFSANALLKHPIASVGAISHQFFLCKFPKEALGA